MNKSGKTPRMVFSEAHNDWVGKGGLWIPNTISACSIKASLIIMTHELIIDLMTLFISILGMMVAIGPTLHMLQFNTVGRLVVIPIAIA
ncbi:hypothetical protein QQ045_014053 [Rhodiola kirilowii]